MNLKMQLNINYSSRLLPTTTTGTVMDASSRWRFRGTTKLQSEAPLQALFALLPVEAEESDANEGDRSDGGGVGVRGGGGGGARAAAACAHAAFSLSSFRFFLGVTLSRKASGEHSAGNRILSIACTRLHLARATAC
jgi:hypothetical protein